MTAVPSTLHLIPRRHTEGCSWWRVWGPLRLLEPLTPCGWAYNDDDTGRLTSHMATFDQIVYQRLGWSDLAMGRQYMDAMHAAGIITIQENDDDTWQWRDEQKSHAELGLDADTELDPEACKASTMLYDGVLVSTERLRTVVHSFAPHMPVEVVGNYIDLQLWREWLGMYDRLPKFHGVTTVGWAGGNRHSADLEHVAVAWRRVAIARPAVEFVVQGYLDPVIRDAVPKDRLHVVEWLPVRPEDGKPFYGVGLKNVDIACLSVAPTLFNEAKTPIKWMEYTAAGAACVVSPTLYGPVVRHASTAMVAETVDDWERHILRLVDRPVWRERLVANAYRSLERSHDLAKNVWRWPAAWARLHEAAVARRQAPRVLVAGARERLAVA